jgi:23S rRNA (pseudouridine1915-N3)-methyltransferase
MDFKIIAFGKLKTPGMSEGFHHYLKSASRLSRIAHVELKPASGDDSGSAAQNDQALLSAFESGKASQKRLVLLDERGKNLTTRQWADHLSQWKDREAVQEVSLAIGSAYGFGDEIRKRSAWTVSLGAQTLPHELARVVLAEQVYRVLTYWAGHPYHHEG